MAETVLPLFDPTAPEQDLDLSAKILEFHCSKQTEVSLPGDLFYFHFDRPHLPAATKEFCSTLETYGRDLVINKPDGNYFRVNIDSHGYCRSITYIGYDKIPSDNYSSLFGIHEKTLNRICARFDEGVITDFLR